MKQILRLSILILLACSTSTLASEKPSDIEFQKILDTKCAKCHARSLVDQAMAEQRDLLEIQQRMLKKGVELDSRERQVLGIFFRSYAAKPVATEPQPLDPLAEYRSVVEKRCTGCHSLAVVEDALRQKRDFNPLAQMMLKRGAVLDDQDMRIIQTFWGEALK